VLLIKSVSQVFGPSFVYDRQFVSADGKDWCLEFEADIEGDSKKRVQGVDLVRLDDDGMIAELCVSHSLPDRARFAANPPPFPRRAARCTRGPRTASAR
jgi:hypothetical protein